MTASRDLETVLARRRATEAWETMTQEPRCTLYAVYDGAREPVEMYRALVASGLPQSCLFGDTVVSPLREAAPRCVHLSANPGVGRELLLAFWGRQAGIFVSADAGTELRAMYKHLKRLLQVKLSTGEKALFRFYDPRVLRERAPATAFFDQSFARDSPGCRSASSGTPYLAAKRLSASSAVFFASRALLRPS